MEMTFNQSLLEECRDLKTDLAITETLLKFVCHEFSSTAPSVWSNLLQTNLDLEAWVAQTKAEEEQTVYYHYKKIYPDFSKEEILKMVAHGILDRRVE